VPCMRPAASIALLVSLAFLAGCSDAPPAGDAAGSVDDPGGTATEGTGTAAQGTLPKWQVGQWWEWQTSFGGETRDETFRSIVVQADGSYLLATENLDMAKQEAAFTHPFLGAVSSSLGMSGFGGDWKLLEFPLTDGKTWTATIPNVAWDVVPATTVDVAMQATYEAALPGYRFMGHLDQGMIIQGTYLPATGWFGELKVFDVDPGEEELEVGFTAVSAGSNYTGPAHTATAERLLLLQDGSGLDNPPPDGMPFVEGPQPQGSFTMASDTLLYGVLQADSVVGSRVITLTDPTNQQRQVVSHGDVDEDEQTLWLDEAGVPGQWQVVTSGAGGFSYAYVELYELTVSTTAL
jgi:hypothetical protein